MSLSKLAKISLSVLLLGAVLVGTLMGLAYYRRNIYVPEGFTRVTRSQAVGGIDTPGGVIVEGKVNGGIRAGTIHVSGGRVQGDIVATGVVEIGPLSRVEGDVTGDTVRLFGDAQVFGDIRAKYVSLGVTRVGLDKKDVVVMTGPNAVPPQPLWRIGVSGQIPTVFGSITGHLGEIDGRVSGDVTLGRGLVSARSVIQGAVSNSRNVIRETQQPEATGSAWPAIPGIDRRSFIMEIPQKGVVISRGPAFPAGPPPGPMGYVHARRPASLLWLPMMWFPLTLGAIALGGIAQVFTGEQMVGVWNRVQSAPLRSFVHGAIGLVITITLLIVLTITIIGIPLAVLLGATASLMGIVGYASMGWGIGKRLLANRSFHPLVELAAGIALLGLLLFVPILGWGVMALMLLVGFGALASLYVPPLLTRKAAA